MDDSKNHNRKKKSKNTKPKPVPSRSKSRKRKTRVSREYQTNENEVQRLLENTSLSFDLGSVAKEPDDVSKSVNFFCKSIDSPVDKSQSECASEDNGLAFDHSTDEGNSHTEDDGESTSTGRALSDHSSTHGNPTTGSAYVHIQLDALTTIGQHGVVELDEELLYYPNADRNVVSIESNQKPFNANTLRLLNRYHEEHGDTKDFEIITKTIKSDVEQASQKYIKDQTLYRSICDYKFHPIFLEPTSESLEIPSRKFLKIHLKELRFTEHPQLEEEHRVANHLEDIYQTYAQRLKEKTCERIYATLQMERRIVNDLLKREAQEMMANDGKHSQERRATVLEKHLLAVKTHRSALYQEEAENKRLLQEILDTWVKLKTLRKQQEHQWTRFRLRIKVDQNSDVSSDRRRWTQRFETDLNEIYREELESYYRAKRLWKKRDRNDENLIRPRKPEIEKLSDELKETLGKSLRQPGEPKIDIFQKRIRDEEFNQNPSKPMRLKSFFMKLYIDGQYVGMTRAYRLEPDLSLAINETVGIFLERRLPKDIRIALYEKSKLPKLPVKIANISVPLALGCDLSEFETQSISFSSHKQPMSGRLTLRFDCDDSIYPTDMAKVSQMLQNQSLNVKYKTEYKNQAETENSDSGSDENDDNVDTKNLDTCTFEEDLLMFCSMNELENNQRFKILRSRYQKLDARTKGLRFVPSLENQMEYTIDDQDEPVLEVGNWMDPIDLHKHEGKKYLKNLYEAIRNQCIRLSKAMDNSENLLVGDEQVTLGMFFQALSSVFRPRRPLNPPRNNSIPSQAPTLNPMLTFSGNDSFKVVLNVVRATGIPVRRSRSTLDADSRQHSSGSSSIFMPQQNFKYSNVRPFIVLSYRDKLCRTTTAEGSNPTWNEQLILELNYSLEDLRDDIKISLFDEVIENHINDDLTVRTMDAYQRIQTNWLADYRIPINTLLSKKKIEGVFEFNSPRVLLGYRRPSFDSISTSHETQITVESMPEMKDAVHMWFYVSIEPSFDLERVNTKCLECSELLEVRRHLHVWCLTAKELQPQRFIDPLVCTVDGKRVCVTRLLEAVPLPVEASENLLDSVCRIVSLLSVQRSYDSCTAFDGVWLNNQTLLDTTWGAPKDMGILLANFLLTIGLSCWVVLCHAHPFGQSTYVLFRSNDQDLFLADPCTGRRYSVRDVFCPISKVDYIIGQDNIYCNIQTETRIAMLNFNVHDSACWLPAFNKRNPAPIGGVQKLNYSYTNSFNTQDLRKNIERKIMKKINGWRAMRKTIWNRAFQMRLQSILQELEHSTTFLSVCNEREDSKYADQLAAEFPNYTMYGFSMNFPYTNLSSISERIKSTGIHLNSDKNVEFSLAVHIHPYTNNILSVWIFLISLSPL